MGKRNNLSLGALGEEIASRYLKDLGYQIVTRNYRQRQGEIDIIALDLGHNELVFCEVKARTGDYFGLPTEAIGTEKRHKIIKTAQFFLHNNQSLTNINYRFDVLGLMIDLSAKEAKVEYIKNAFI